MKRLILLRFFAFQLFANDTDLSSPILKKYHPYADTLIVAFGGVGVGLARHFPPFEFFRMLGSFNVHKMFVRDLQKSWYQRGLFAGQDVDSAINLLREEVQSFNANRIIFVGNSAGGYAALLFGLLLNVNEVHAFVPYTNLYQCALKEKNQLNQKYFLLKPIFENHPNTNTQFHIYFCDDSQRDVIQMSHFVHGDNIHYHVYQDRGGHNLIKALRKTGELNDILKKAIAGS